MIVRRRDIGSDHRRDAWVAREPPSRGDDGLISTDTMCERPRARLCRIWPTPAFRCGEAECAPFRPSCLAAASISASVAVGNVGIAVVLLPFMRAPLLLWLRRLGPVGALAPMSNRHRL